MSASCHIQKYSTDADGHTQFFVVVLFHGKEWAIRKRYSEFRKLDRYLKRRGFNINQTLPPKDWWNRFDPTLLARRQRELQTYLDLLTTTVPTDNSLVKEFLEVDSHFLELAKKQSFHHLSYSDQLQAIVKQTKQDMLPIPKIALRLHQNMAASTSSSLAGAAPLASSSKKTSSFSRRLSTTLLSSPIGPSGRLTLISTNTPPSSSSFSSVSGESTPTNTATTGAAGIASSNSGVILSSSGSQSLSRRRQSTERSYNAGDRKNSTPDGGAVGAPFSIDPQDALIDAIKREAFQRHVEDVMSDKDTLMYAKDMLESMDALPPIVCNHDDELVVRVLSEPLGTLVQALECILQLELDNILEAAPKNTLMFVADDLVAEIRGADIPVDGSGALSSRHRSRTRSTSQDSLSPSGTQLRLRRNPSDAQLGAVDGAGTGPSLKRGERA
jgi:PX domain